MTSQIVSFSTAASATPATPERENEAGGEGGIRLSPAAARKVVQLVAANGRPQPLLRVYIEGGGCSGFQYGFDFEDEVAEDDVVVENDGVKLLVDPMSVHYLDGARVDYLEDLQGSRFVVSNPNASTTCGCGSSFSI